MSQREDPQTSLSAQPHHVHLCFHALSSHLSSDGGHAPNRLFSHFDALLTTESFPPCPLFITWNTRINSSRKDLRGCIGTFQAQPLSKGLQRYALTAALRDTRFPPIKAHELERLECSVSLLHAFEEASRWDDWEVGVHGISIRFRLDTVYSATFLPEVASDQGWSVYETVWHLIRKAGCHISDEWVWKQSDVDGDMASDDDEACDHGGTHRVLLSELLERMHVERYQSSKCSASYTEYLEYLEFIERIER